MLALEKVCGCFRWLCRVEGFRLLKTYVIAPPEMIEEVLRTYLARSIAFGISFVVWYRVDGTENAKLMELKT